MALMRLFIVLVISTISLTAQDKLQIICSFSILEDVIEAVGGDKIEVQSLATRNQEPHAYRPTAKDVARLQSADLVVLIGDGFEPRIEAVLHKQIPVLFLNEHLFNLIPLNGHTHVHIIDGEEVPCTAGEHDPHIWMDPKMMKQVAQIIRDEFKELQPSAAAYFQHQSDVYQAELNELDVWIAREIARIPPAQRVLVTGHDAFSYYKRAYGFKDVRSSIITAMNPEGADPSPKELIQIIKEIREYNIPVIFAELGHSPRLAETVAREAGIRCERDLATGFLGEKESDYGTYMKFMRYNTNKIVRALIATTDEN